MDYLDSFAISAAGMNVERLRVDVSALNLANAHAAIAPGVTAYQPLRVVAQPGGMVGFPEVVQGLTGPQASVQAADSPERQVLEPGNPAADPQGYVHYPGVDTAMEMMTIMSATRAYEANVAALNASRSMAAKALEIGKNA